MGVLKSKFIRQKKEQIQIFVQNTGKEKNWIHTKKKEKHLHSTKLKKKKKHKKLKERKFI